MNDLTQLLNLECYWIQIRIPIRIMLISHLDHSTGSIQALWRYNSDY